MRVRALEKKMEKVDLTIMALQRLLERSKREVGRLKCENTFLRQTTAGVLHSTVHEVGTPSTRVHWLLEALEPQYAGRTMCVTQRLDSVAGRR